MRFIKRFYNYYFAPNKGLAKRLKPLLGYTPTNLKLYVQAFAHKSSHSQKLSGSHNNERLEYLGDAVLGTIVAEYLFKKYPNKDEGFLTKMRSKIVKRKTLDTVGENMGLDAFLGEFNATRLSRSMMGNAVEALVGAVYLERGYNKTKYFVINKMLRLYVNVIALETFDDNYKSQLLEWCQKNGKIVSYKTVSKYKMDKRDRFKVAVYINDEKIATADDFNKKSAEQHASLKALKILKIYNNNHTT